MPELSRNRPRSAHRGTAAAPPGGTGGPFSPEDEDRSETTLHVSGLCCPEEFAGVTDALKGVSGISGIRPNYLTGCVTIGHSRSVSPETLQEALRRAGWETRRAATTRERFREEDGGNRRIAWAGLAVSAILFVAGGLGFLLDLPQVVVRGLFAGSIGSAGWLIAPKAWSALRRLSPDMNLLMSAAVIGAVILGNWAEGAMVVLLFALAEMLEASSVRRSRNAVRSLMNLAPEVALRKQGEKIDEVPVESLAVGDRLLVRSGARIPLDGRIVSGRSHVDQATITGEPLPVEKGLGDEVFAGTLNQEGALELEVTKKSGETTLDRIVQLVEDAQSRRATAQRFVDRFARYYTPSVMAVALAAMVAPPLIAGTPWADSVYRGLVFLVIACPCALVISTPISIFSGITAMARRGVLIKGGSFLEALADLKTVVLDKTGTVTMGRPHVKRSISWDGVPEETLLQIAASINQHSQHPYARALLERARALDVPLKECRDFRARPGAGVEGRIDGHLYFVGHHATVHESGHCTEEIETTLRQIEKQGNSMVLIYHQDHEDCEAEVLGVFEMADEVRAGAAEAIRDLRKAGVEKLVLLSGDHKETVSSIGTQLRFDEICGDLLPHQKAEQVAELVRQGGSVGMVGDGINDAPAMAEATIGIAMGAAGSDAALDTADVALMEDDLRRLAPAIRMGRRTVRTIRCNIAFALIAKAAIFGLAVVGLSSLWLAIAADTGATLLVVANSLRLLR